MTIVEMLSWFDIISDKESSPYFTEAEKLQFLNVAQDDYVNELVFSLYLPSLANREGPARVYSAAESSSSGIEILEPLLVPEIRVSSNSLGVIPRSVINAAIANKVGHNATYIAIDSVALVTNNQNYLNAYTEAYDACMLACEGDGCAETCNVTATEAANLAVANSETSLPVRFVRHNDFHKFQNNIFKAASAFQPQYRIFKDELKFLPAGVAAYKISLIKRPIRMFFNPITPGENINCELPEVTHNKIVAIALEHAFKATRDEIAHKMQQYQNATRV